MQSYRRYHCWSTRFVIQKYNLLPNWLPTDQLYSGLADIRESIPDTVASDREIKDALWYYYFDVEKSLNWVLGAWSMTLSTNLTIQ